MKLISKIDNSVNFIEEALAGFFETRYVRKCDEYFICYLSSQNNCNKACKFCFLTAMKQTKTDDSLPIDFLSQASKVLKHYKASGKKANYANLNFMARGEVLSNRYILNDADSILYDLGRLVTTFDPDLGVRFNISTIMPRDLNKSLKDIFKIIHPTIYYSFYSANDKFRKKWLPNAMEINKSMALLKEYQEFSKKKIKLHHCFIEGENDSVDDVYGMIDKINEFKLDCEFNLVRYNPYSSVQGKESSDEVLARNLDIITRLLPSFDNKVQEIPRVGRDVAASCGTFIEKLDYK